MTTIAANKEEIACDQQGTHASGYKIKLLTKVQEFNQPLLWRESFYVGLAGNLNDFSDIFSWFLDPTEWKKPPHCKSTEGLVLTKDGKLFAFFQNPAKWISLNQNTYSVGSGSPYALAAMASGKSPAEAVKVATKFDPSTGMGVKKYLASNLK